MILHVNFSFPSAPQDLSCQTAKQFLYAKGLEESWEKMFNSTNMSYLLSRNAVHHCPELALVTGTKLGLLYWIEETLEDKKTDHYLFNGERVQYHPFASALHNKILFQ